MYRNGSITIGVSGNKASIAWRTIYARCSRKRRNPMGAKSNATSDTAPRELVITRIFDAPRSLVFRAWTHPDHLKRWWGPHGFTVLACAMDFRVGGGWSLSMQSPAG